MGILDRLRGKRIDSAPRAGAGSGAGDALARAALEELRARLASMRQERRQLEARQAQTKATLERCSAEYAEAAGSVRGDLSLEDGSLQALQAWFEERAEAIRSHGEALIALMEAWAAIEGEIVSLKSQIAIAERDLS